MNVRLYVLPGCTHCTATEAAFTAKDIQYQIVSLETDAATRELVKSLGYLQAPVVITDTDHWSGFRPDKISELAATLTDKTKGSTANE